MLEVHLCYQPLPEEDRLGVRVVDAEDADALLDLKAAITNMDDFTGWGFKGWQDNTNPCAGWTGVTCSNAKSAVGLDLSEWAVKGALPPTLCALDDL